MGSIYKNGIAYASGGGGGASDSGWLELTGTAAINPDYKIYYRKVGAFVYVQTLFQFARNISANTQTTLFTLPEGFRPKIPTIPAFKTFSTSTNTYSDITSGLTFYLLGDGTCTIKYGYSLSSSTTYCIDVAFVSA